MVTLKRVFLNILNKHPLIPATRFPILKENEDIFDTLPLVISKVPCASATVPSAKALKEAIKSHPALISAPMNKLPSAFAQYLVADPEPDLNPNPAYIEPPT